MVAECRCKVEQHEANSDNEHDRMVYPTQYADDDVVATLALASLFLCIFLVFAISHSQNYWCEGTTKII